MKVSSTARRYALLSGVLATTTALALTPFALAAGESSLRWAGLGWSSMAVIGIGGGAWAAGAHGKPGSAFIIAVGTCMLARLAASAAGAAAAATSGMGAVWPYLAGLATGFVPLQVFEIGWFLKHDNGSMRHEP